MLTGISGIDAFAAGLAATSVSAGDGDKDAVGAIQDLLIGHGAHELPGILNPLRGTYGPKTRAAVSEFQSANGLAGTGNVDSGTFKMLIDVPAVSPIAAQVYVTLVLGLPWTGMTRLVALTTQFEAAGKFTACNRNTDRAGLSFGIIQWAQRPGRLFDIVHAFQQAQPSRFVDVFGSGDAAVAGQLLDVLERGPAAVDAQGKPLDPDFDLAADAWIERFRAAGRDRGWQKTQLTVAIDAFQTSLKAVQSAAPLAKSERAVAFLLDVANQHGDGGMHSICAKIATPGMSEAEFLKAAQDESVRRLAAQFGETSDERESTFERREAFRTTPLLSDGPLRV